MRGLKILYLAFIQAESALKILSMNDGGRKEAKYCK